ncbi:hypothetical protein BGW41_005677 [Actinomortierella wolfii]|nr:hypothetical protein BGW41_005677 [Actinomortierella wolfii]
MAEPVIRVQEPTTTVVDTTVRTKPLGTLQTVSQAKKELEARLLAIHEDLQLTQNIGLLFVKRQEDLRTCFEQLEQLEQLEQQQQQQQQQQHGLDGDDQSSSLAPENELPPAFKEHLNQLDKEFQEGQNGLLGLKGLIDAQLPSTETTSNNDTTTQASSVLGPSALPSSTLPVQNITKPRRHKVVMPSVPSINDPNFPVQIQEELLNQVRYWTSQAEMKEKLNQEYDTKIQEMERIIDALNKQRRLREESEERQKEDQWNLELLNQELRTQNSELQSQLSKAVHENQKLQKSFAAVTEQLEQLKDKEEKTAGQLELTKARHEQDMQTMRKHTAGLQRDKSDLLKKMEELNNLVSLQEKKLKTKASQEAAAAAAAAAASAEHSEAEEKSRSASPELQTVVPEEPTPAEVEMDHAADLAEQSSASDGKQTSLARETSFAHQQAIISELQTKLSQSMSERDELKKLLADREETIEQLRFEGSVPSFPHHLGDRTSSFGHMSHSSRGASEAEHLGGHGDILGETGGFDNMEGERMDSLASELEGPRSSTPMRGLFDELAQASGSSGSSAPSVEVKDEEVMTDPIDQWVLTLPMVAEKLASLEAAKETLTAQAAEATKALQEAQAAQASQATESESSSEALKAAQAAQESYAARVQEVTAALEAARAEAAEAMRLAAEAQAAKEAQASELAKAKAEQEAQAAELAQVKALQETQSKELTEANEAREAYVKELAEAKAARETYVKELAEAKAAHEAYVKELAEAKAAREAHVKELAEAKAAHEAYVKELAEAKAAREAHIKELAEAKAEHEAYVQELAEVKAAREAQVQELAQAKIAQEEHIKQLEEAKAAQEAHAKELAEAKAAQEVYAKELAEAKAAATTAAAALAAATAATAAAGVVAAAKSTNQDAESTEKEAPIQVSKGTQVTPAETTSNSTQTAAVERANASTSPRASVDGGVSSKKGDLADIITGKPGTQTMAIDPVESALVTPTITSLEVAEAQLQEQQHQQTHQDGEVTAAGKDGKIGETEIEPVRRKVPADAYLNEPRRHTCDMSQGMSMSGDEVPPVPDVPLHHRDSVASAATGSTAPRDAHSERDYRVSIGSAFGSSGNKSDQGTMSTGRIRSVYNNSKEGGDDMQYPDHPHHTESAVEHTDNSIDPVSPGRPASSPPSDLLAKARTLAQESALANDVSTKDMSVTAETRVPSSPDQPSGRAPSIRSVQLQQRGTAQPTTSSPQRPMVTGAAVISGPTRTAYTFQNNSSQVHAPNLNTLQPHHHVITDSSGQSIRRHYRPSPNGSISSMSTDYGHDRRLSISSNYDNGPTATDPTMIQIITQTMIGDYLWKYTRRTMTSMMSEKRHRRYFWVHPYTRTMYWSMNNPAADGSREQRAKSASILAVYEVADDNPVNSSDLPNISLIVQTTTRSLKLTAPSREKHDLWFQSLSYLLSRPTTPGADVPTDYQTWPEVQASRGVTSDTLLTIRSSERQVRKKGSMTRLQNMFGRSKDTSPASSPRGFVSASSHSLATGTHGGAGNSNNNNNSVIGYPSHMAHTGANVVGGHGTVNGGPIISQQGSSDLGTASSPRSRMNEVYNAHNKGLLEDDEVDDEYDDEEDDVLPEQVRQCCDGRHDIGSLHHNH